ncbi:hypothetical protein CTE07_10990 [Chitinophaga terrae (ex Kim and Jung 2007)]|nr:hypothetical protein CTE07_10990 [Chitinophaga terrae (ex Kim and Jung 2007)]
MDEYIAELDRIFEAATRNFREVYFKFHPREKPADIKRIEDVMSKYQVTLLATKQPIELVIDEIRPQYVASFYSSALKSLFLRGVQPFFLYHLLQVFRDRSIVDTLNKYLQYINYLFIKKYDDIKPGYRCSILTDASALTFKEFIDRL